MGQIISGENIEQTSPNSFEVQMSMAPFDHIASMDKAV
jgi:hypothetical protein